MIAASSQSQSVPGRYRTAAEWWDALGRVPMDRIVFDPHPGTATEADLLRLADHEDRLCELLDGTLVEKTMGYEESAVAIRIAYLLTAFVMPRKLGIVTGPDGMMRLLGHRVRIPDVAFVSWASLPGGSMPRQPIPDLTPDLAVEVLSESNTPREMSLKLGDYFQAGAKLVWLVDPRTREVEVYASPDSMTRLHENDTLTGGAALEGFEVPVRDIFAVGLK